MVSQTTVRTYVHCPSVRIAREGPGYLYKMVSQTTVCTYIHLYVQLGRVHTFGYHEKDLKSVFFFGKDLLFLKREQHLPSYISTIDRVSRNILE